jgi:hypothetical protein
MDPQLTLACDNNGHATGHYITYWLLYGYDMCRRNPRVSEEVENRKRIIFKTWKWLIRLTDRYVIYSLKKGLNALLTPYISNSCDFDPLRKKMDILTPYVLVLFWFADFDQSTPMCHWGGIHVCNYYLRNKRK